MPKTYTAEELDEIQRQFEALLFVAETAVVIIDKQVTVRKTIRRMLEELGVEKDAIFEADDDVKAQAFIDKSVGKKLVIITELNFARPQCDGVKMIQKLRRDAQTSNATILIVSDERKKERVDAVMKMNPAGYFKKPLDAAALKAKLKDLDVAS